MNECDTTRRLSAYLDGELDAAQIEAIDAHLAGCGHCQAELRRMQELSRTLGRFEAPALSPDVRERMLHLAERAPIRRLQRLASGLGAMAASFALVATMWAAYWADSAQATAIAPLESWERAALQLPEEQAPATPEAEMAEWMMAQLYAGGNERE